MIIVVLLLSMLRGLFILLFGLPNSPQIFFSFTIISIGLVLVKSNLFFWFRHPNRLKVYLQLFVFNILLGMLWFVADISYGNYFDSTKIFLFYFIIPISVLSFMSADKEILHKVILYASTFIAVSCIVEFVILNIFPGGIIGIEIVRIPLKMISPDSQMAAFAHIGPIYRAHGITGHYHDSGNILAMSSVYLAGTYFFTRKNFTLFLLALVNIFGLITTLSMANIIAGFLGLFFVSFFKVKGFIGRLITTTFVLILLGFSLTYYFDPNEYRELYTQFDWQGEKMIHMRNTGTSDSITIFISMLLGHEVNSGISDISRWSEAGIIHILMNFGLFLFFPLIVLIAHPIYLYFNTTKEKKDKMWVPYIAICTGILTLWHYGSLFRSTSIFLFFALSSMVFKVYVENYKENNRIILNKYLK